MVAMESLILFKRNKTADWLRTKSQCEKEKLFKACIKVGRQQRQIHHQREESIKAYQQSVLRAREEAFTAKRRKEQLKKESLCQKISKNGFWNSEAKMRAGLAGKSESNRKNSLEIQLRFRQHVLKQSFENKSVYCLSKKGKKLPSSELSVNLLKLITVTQQVALEKILKSPNLLVGMEIEHRFEDEDGTQSWYNGIVIGMLNMEYEVIYIGEDTVYQFDLLTDLSSGDLKVIFDP